MTYDWPAASTIQRIRCRGVKPGGERCAHWRWGDYSEYLRGDYFCWQHA